MEVSQPTADNTSASPFQSLPGSTLSAPDDMASEKLSPEVVNTDEQQQQPVYIPGKSLPSTLSQQTAEVLCTPASVSSQGESGSVQHDAAGICQEHSSGSVSDVQCCHTAAADARQNAACGPSAEPLQQLAAAMLWHRDAVFPHQHSGLQIQADAELADTEEVPGTPSQSSSEVDAERILQQNADSCSCAAAFGHLRHLQIEGSSSGLSSCQSECMSSAELGAVAADGDKHDARQPNMPAGVPTSSWVDRPSSADHSSEACSGDLMVTYQHLTPLTDTARCAKCLLHDISPSTCGYPFSG